MYALKQALGTLVNYIGNKIVTGRPYFRVYRKKLLGFFAMRTCGWFCLLLLIAVPLCLSHDLRLLDANNTETMVPVSMSSNTTR